MATQGSMEAFNPQAEDWTIYAERLQHYLVANGVEDADKKRAILLTVCGASTYKLLRSLVEGCWFYSAAISIQAIANHPFMYKFICILVPDVNESLPYIAD